MATNEFSIVVEALDAEQGYLLRGKMWVDNALTEINEHYDTEAEVATRLQSGWSFWASQVDSEPPPP